jgi:hypothetical protein
MRIKSVPGLALCVVAACAVESRTTTSTQSSPSTPGNQEGPPADGTGAPSAGGSSDDNTTQAVGDDGICSPNVVTTSRLIPDLLIVLDRSGSMNTGDVNRWTPSVAALKEVTARLDDVIHFGLMAFPGAVAAPPPVNAADPCAGLTGWQAITCAATGGAVNLGAGASCEAGTLVVPVEPGTAAAIGSALDGMSPSGSTPTASTLKAAHDALGSGLTEPDSFTPPKFVLLVTDGEPRCGNGDQASVEDTVTEIEKLAADGIKTYVVGYETEGGATGQIMDRMAAAGGTGSTQHIPVQNEAQLIAALEDIAGRAASCTFLLDERPADPTFVNVQVNGEPVRFDDLDKGWTLSEDGLQVLIQGEACETLRSGEGNTLQVDVLCSPVF